MSVLRFVFKDGRSAISYTLPDGRTARAVLKQIPYLSWIHLVDDLTGKQVSFFVRD